MFFIGSDEVYVVLRIGHYDGHEWIRRGLKSCLIQSMSFLQAVKPPTHGVVLWTEPRYRSDLSVAESTGVDICEALLPV
jgi:hypothetical protein